MHSPTTNSSINPRNTLPEEPQRTSSPQAPLATQTKVKSAKTTEGRTSKRSSIFKSLDNNKHSETPQPLIYISFSTFGIQEPEGPKSLEVLREEHPPPTSPPTALQRIKSVLAFETNQK